MADKECKGIWIIAEHKEGKLKGVTLELLGKSRQFADRLGVKLTAVLLGKEIEKLAQELIYYGADEVLLVESRALSVYKTVPYAEAIAALLREYKPSIVLLGATAQGRDLAPRIMAKMQTGLTADCLDLEIDERGGLVQIKPSFGG